MKICRPASILGVFVMSALLALTSSPVAAPTAAAADGPNAAGDLRGAAPEGLGGVLTSGPDPSSWAPGRLDIFTRGAGGDDALWHIWYDGQPGSRWAAF